MIQRETMDSKTTSVFSRDYSKFSVEFGDVNDQFNDFYFKLDGCVDRHAPLQKLNPKEVKLTQKPWITN